MGFSQRQLNALRRDVKREYIRKRIVNGRELSYVEGSHAITEANRIFGFEGWDRETLESRCVTARENRGTFLVVYTSKVRITVRAEGERIVREGHGCGEARGSSPGETHDLALKTSETDATKRALATFGKPFGLSLYISGKVKPAPDDQRSEQLLASEGVISQSNTARSEGIDKAVLKFGMPRRSRDRDHMKFVASQPCLLCDQQPSDPHHLRFAQPVALGMKVSDEFTVPLCREHHRQLHRSGNERAWWHDMGIEPLEIAKTLWDETCAKRAPLNVASGQK